MKIIFTYKKHRAINDYIKKLPALLIKDHGRKKRYQAQQIKTTAQRYGLNIDHICYAMALFCSPRNFNIYHQNAGESCDYDAMRGEIANRYFDGRSDFQNSEAYISMTHTADSGAFDSGIDSSSGD